MFSGLGFKGLGFRVWRCAYTEVQAVILAPIAPHTCEHLWSFLLKKEGLVIDAEWPILPYDHVLHRY